MTTRTTRQPTARRSSRRPPTDPDLSKLRSFPPPTETSEQLAVANLDLASHQARKFAAATKMTGILCDLEAVAWTGLLNACRRYDPKRINPGTGRPYTIATAAVPFIDGAMRRFLRDRGHAIKFPYAWLEKAPRARREVLSGKCTIEQAAAIVGMDPLDVGEMLHCMGPTEAIQDEHFQTASGAPDLPDEDGPTMLAAELQLARLALSRLGDDRQLLVDWWTSKHRRRCPSGPLQQFWRRAGQARRSLPDEPIIVQSSMFPEPQAAAKDPAQMVRILNHRAELMGVLPPAGKLNQDLTMADGVGATGSPNRQRRSAVVRASDAARGRQRSGDGPGLLEWAEGSEGEVSAEGNEGTKESVRIEADANQLQ